MSAIAKQIAYMEHNYPAGGEDSTAVSAWKLAIGYAKRMLDAEKNRPDIVIWEGTARPGEPGLSLFAGRGDQHSTLLVPVEYQKVKGKRGRIAFIPD